MKPTWRKIYRSNDDHVITIEDGKPIRLYTKYQCVMKPAHPEVTLYSETWLVGKCDKCNTTGIIYNDSLPLNL